MGGHNEPESSTFDIIDYVNIASTGNAVDFGNCKFLKQKQMHFLVLQEDFTLVVIQHM